VVDEKVPSAGLCGCVPVSAITLEKEEKGVTIDVMLIKMSGSL